MHLDPETLLRFRILIKIGILCIGNVDSTIIERVIQNLGEIFPDVKCQRIPYNIPIPQETFDFHRNQYRSDMILNIVENHARKSMEFNRLLGVIDADIFVPGLNFVFGEATCPGKAALISIRRLRPEFYNAPANFELLIERSTKEAVHELGHTFGLRHCANPFCVMYFSNSIFETDRKKSLFCNRCYLELQKLLDELGGEA